MAHGDDPGDETDQDLDALIRKSATERPPLSDEERSRRVEQQYAARRHAKRMWAEIERNVQRGNEP